MPREVWRLRGADDLLKALGRLEKGMRDEMLKDATQAGADVLADAWRARVPVDDGDYRNSIRARARAGKKGATGVVDIRPGRASDGGDGPRAYASRLEFGTAYASKAAFKSGTAGAGRVRHAQPSLRPAYDAVEGQMLDAMSDKIRDLIEAST